MGICVSSQDLPYFLEYSPGLELNPLLIWTRVIMDHEIN